MTLQELQQTADTAMSSIWDTFTAKQNTYYQNHGRYFGLWATSEAIPEEGVSLNASINIDPREEHPEEYNFVLPAQLPFQLLMHQHGDAGYTVTIKMIHGGTTYIKKISQGTVDQNLAWSELTEITIN